MKEGVPSATARLIAAATARAPFQPNLRDLAPGAAVEWSARFLSTRPVDRRMLRRVQSPIWRPIWRVLEGVTIPGLARHWLVRKAWIEREWRAASARGFSQLIVIGAGLDTLGVRVAQDTPGARVIELDHPSTQALKKAALDPAPPMALLPCDLGRDRFSDVLRSAGALDPARDTMIICEGLLMYLPQARVEAMLAEMAALPVPRLKVALTVMQAGGGRPEFVRQRAIVKWWLARRSEPFRSAPTPDSMVALLERTGFGSVSCEDISTRDPGGTPQPAIPPLRGELLALAERGGLERA
jgi:methyltransferase (TIGR00027 family)